MKTKCIARAADNTTFTRLATKAYDFAVIYRKQDGGFCTPTFHTRRHLAERAAADLGCAVSAEIVEVEIVPPTAKQLSNEIAKTEKRIDFMRANNYRADIVQHHVNYVVALREALAVKAA